MRKDGRRIESEVGADLDYLSQISRRLGVVDLVEEYFAPVVGEWNDLHDEAERWRAAGRAAEAVTKDLLKPLGRLDSAWQGASADSFVDHMRKVGLAGNDLTDSMTAMGDALEETAEGIRGIVEDMARVFRDTADVVSGAAGLPLDGDARVLGHLDELREPAREMYESVRDVLEAFLRLCDGLSGVDAEFSGPGMEHRYPERDWAFVAPGEGGVSRVAVGVPVKAEGAGGAVGAGAKADGAVGGVGGGSVSGALPTGGAVGSVGGAVGGESVGGVAGSAPAAGQGGPVQYGGYTAVQEPQLGEGGAVRPAAASGGGGGTSGGQPVGGGMMGAPMGGGGQQGGDKEHKAKVRIAGSAEDVLGKPKKSAPPVVGQD